MNVWVLPGTVEERIGNFEKHSAKSAQGTLKLFQRRKKRTEKMADNNNGNMENQTIKANANGIELKISIKLKTTSEKSENTAETHSPTVSEPEKIQTQDECTDENDKTTNHIMMTRAVDSQPAQPKYDFNVHPLQTTRLNASQPDLRNVVKREKIGRRGKLNSGKTPSASMDKFWSARMAEWREDLNQFEFVELTSVRWKSVSGALDGSGDDDMEEIRKEIERDTDPNLVTGKAKKILWRHTPQVIASKVLSSMSDERKNFQESIFEVLTSQASYVHHLFILESCFMKNMRLCVPDIISRRTYDNIFSKIQPIISSSSVFYAALLQLWRTDICLTGLCSVIEPYYRKYRNLYIAYARDIQCIVDDYESEMEDNQKLRKVVTVFENFYQAEGQSLYSYINMPLQRVTRLPLLMKNVLSHIRPESPDFETYSNALSLVNALAMDCNAECDKIRHCKIILNLAKTFHFEFADGVPPISVLLSQRRLLLMSTVRRQKVMGWIRPTEYLELFLFHDLFVYAARPNIAKDLVVLDYCKRKEVYINLINHSEMNFYLVNNCNGRWASLTVVFESATERVQWKHQLDLSMSKVCRRALSKRRNCPSSPPLSPAKIGYYQDFQL